MFVCRTQRGAKDWSATRSVQGQMSIIRYFCHPSLSCVSLYRFERKSVSTLSIFCLRVRVKLFEAIYQSVGRFSYNTHVIIGMTPYDKWYGNEPSISKVRVFGSNAWAMFLMKGKTHQHIQNPTTLLFGYSEKFQG